MHAEENRREWESAAAAARLAGTTPEVIRRLAKQGFISVRRLPGCDPRYLMADVERISQQMTTPANRARPATPPPIPSEPSAITDGVVPPDQKGGV